jgi:hypothetical protein
MKHPPIASATVLISLFLILCDVTTWWSPSSSSFVTARKDRNAPHPHRGLLLPYEPGPFPVVLNAEDEALLQQGKPVMKQNLPKPGSESGGGAICIQDIMAPKAAVWNQILDLEGYQGKVPKVQCSKNYSVRRNPDGSTNIKTKMVLGVLPGYSVCDMVSSGRTYASMRCNVSRLSLSSFCSMDRSCSRFISFPS